MSLTEKTCIPCQGNLPALSKAEAEALLQQTPKWTLLANPLRLRRAISFDNFAEALDFVNKLGALAEIEQHHPDIQFGWGYCEVVFYTHKINGLHENDFILAAKTDQLIHSLG